MQQVKPSFNKRLLAYIAGFATLLLFFYTLLTIFYLDLGLGYGLQFQLEGKANTYRKAYLSDPNSALPQGGELFTYRDIQSMPKPLLELFPIEKKKHKGLMHFVESVDDIPLGHPATRLPELCDNKSCQMLFLYTYQLEKDEWLYMVVAKEESELFQVHHDELNRVLFLSIGIGIALLVLILIFAYILLRKVAKPINALTDWADQLTLKNLNDPLPDLRYRELTNLAMQMRASLKKVEDSVEHERKFLANASHELRTPIAVQQTNISLLKKLGVWVDDGSESAKAQDRIYRASVNMRQLTETLLWLSRDFQSLPQSKPVSLLDLINDLIEENRYLLKHKLVDVEIENMGANIEVPQSLSRIVLNNLIRNAFQYTHQGFVKIKMLDNNISVMNQCSYSDEINDQESSFGLGLALVEQICAKAGWDYRMQAIEGGYHSVVSFASDSANQESPN